MGAEPFWLWPRLTGELQGASPVEEPPAGTEDAACSARSNCRPSQAAILRGPRRADPRQQCPQPRAWGAAPGSDGWPLLADSSALGTWVCLKQRTCWSRVWAPYAPPRWPGASHLCLPRVRRQLPSVRAEPGTLSDCSSAARTPGPDGPLCLLWTPQPSHSWLSWTQRHFQSGRKPPGSSFPVERRWESPSELWCVTLALPGALRGGGGAEAVGSKEGEGRGQMLWARPVQRTPGGQQGTLQTQAVSQASRSHLDGKCGLRRPCVLLPVL